ncbi:MAG TPA: hypothetical protein VFP34_16110 [Microlunatus sp.]|nr:hypothetical protein [Microlunatus sp.]
MVTYEIRIDGTLPPEIVENLCGIGTIRPAGTTVEVNVADDAALWGLIEALRASGVDMLEVRRQHGEADTED